MGFRLSIGGKPFQMQGFSVQEASTPLAAGDSSGQVGTLTISIPRPDPEVDPYNPLVRYGENWLVGKSIRLDDSRKGFTLGDVTSIQVSNSTGLIQVSANSRLGRLNVYNVQAQPFSGTLANAFEQYLALANITTDFLVDPSISTLPVVFPGWNGELWFHLKQMAAAIDCDLSLVSGVILLRPIRKRTVTRGRDTERGRVVGGGSLAQSVAVIQYNNRPITGELVYPPGGWSEDVSTINVNAGETIEDVLELSASVSSIVQPIMQTFVSKTHSTSSVFTVVGDDGLPIQPSAWSANGGSLSVSINPDTTSLTVKITAPTGLPNKDGNEIGVYGISLSSDSSTGRYSTLRIIGSGVAFNKEEVRVPTGLTAAQTATEVGVTIDNPFLSNAGEVYTAGIRAARAYNGTAMSLSGTVTAVNQRGNTGEVVLRTYADVQDIHNARTYAQVQTLNSGLSYLQVQDNFNSGIQDEFENQVFGNASGARVWDESSKRWYRIRSTTLNPDLITFDAEDDTTHGDYQTAWTGQTYAAVQLRYNGFSYFEADLMGVR